MSKYDDLETTAQRVYKYLSERYKGEPQYFPYKDIAEEVGRTLPPAVQAANARADRERFYSRRKNKAQAQADHNFEKAMRAPAFMQTEQELKSLDIEEAKAEIYHPEKLPDIYGL